MHVPDRNYAEAIRRMRSNEPLTSQEREALANLLKSCDRAEVMPTRVTRDSDYALRLLAQGGQS